MDYVDQGQAQTVDIATVVNAGHVLAAIAFFLLFPVYFFYQISVQAGYIEPVLGGYFTAGAIAALPLLAISYKQHASSLVASNSFIAFAFFAFLALLGFRVLIGMQTGADDEITLSHLAYILKFVALFLIALLVNGQARGFRRLLNVLMVGIIATVLVTGSEGQFLQAALLEALYEGFLLDYQGLAYAYIVLVIYCAPSLSRNWRITLYAASLASLFLIGARSEFVGLVLLAGVIEFCKSRSRQMFFLVLGVLILISVVSYLALQDSLGDNRILGLLKLSSDQSAIERGELHSLALHTIAANPLFGSYASYEPGYYAHNILSAWVDLGLAGFLLLAALLAIPAISLLKQFRRCSRDDLYVQSLSSMLLTAVLLLFAKNYTYQMIPIAIGLYCRFEVVRRSQFSLPILGQHAAVAPHKPDALPDRAILASASS
jgi:hypothetical protein